MSEYKAAMPPAPPQQRSPVKKRYRMKNRAGSGAHSILFFYFNTNLSPASSQKMRPANNTRARDLVKKERAAKQSTPSPRRSLRQQSNMASSLSSHNPAPSPAEPLRKSPCLLNCSCKVWSNHLPTNHTAGRETPVSLGSQPGDTPSSPSGKCSSIFILRANLIFCDTTQLLPSTPLASHPTFCTSLMRRNTPLGLACRTALTMSWNLPTLTAMTWRPRSIQRQRSRERLWTWRVAPRSWQAMRPESVAPVPPLRVSDHPRLSVLNSDIQISNRLCSNLRCSQALQPRNH